MDKDDVRCIAMLFTFALGIVLLYTMPTEGASKLEWWTVCILTKVGALGCFAYSDYCYGRLRGGKDA